MSSEITKSKNAVSPAALNIARRYMWVLILLPIFVAMLAAIAVSLGIRPTWEATVVLEVGRIGQVGAGGLAPSVSVEPASNTVLRMMHPSFHNNAFTLVASQIDEKDAAKDVLINSLKASVAKDSDLIEVKLRGYSPEMARALIGGVIANLQFEHNKMLEATLSRYQGQIQNLNADIRDAQEEIALLKKKLMASKNWNAYDATLSATVLQNKSSELRDMVQRKLLLEEQVNPSRTYTTRLIGDVYVSTDPVAPKRSLIILLAALMGMAGAVLFTLVHSQFRPAVVIA